MNFNKALLALAMGYALVAAANEQAAREEAEPESNGDDQEATNGQE